MTRSSISEAGQDSRLKASTNNEPGLGRDAVAFNPLHPSMELPPERLNQYLNMGSEKTRNRTMTTRSQISDAAQEARPSAAAEKETGARRAAVAFNPLHPSMELPPEQLIRLLSMASKKTRKQMKEKGLSGQGKPRPVPQGRQPQASSASPVLTEEHSSAGLRSDKEAGSRADRETPRLHREQKTPQAPAKAQKSRQASAEKRTPAPTSGKKRRSATGADNAAASGDQQPSRARAAANTTRQATTTATPESHSLPSRHNRRRRGAAHYQGEKPRTSNKRGPGWLLLALVVGLVTGAALSAVLFWHQTSSTGDQKIAPPPVSGETRKPQSAKQAPTKQVKRKPAPASDKARALPAQAPAAAKAAGGRTDAQWQAATEKEQVRVRKAAEQRFAEKLTRVQVEQERADLQATSADHAEPATAVKPPVTVEPAVEQAAVSAPEAADTEPSAAPQAGVELTGADAGRELAMEADPMPAPPALQDVAPAEHDETMAEPLAAEEAAEDHSVQQMAPTVGASDAAPASDGSSVADTQQSVDTNPVAADSEPAPLDSEPVELTATDNASETEQSADGSAVESQMSAAEDEDSF
jgi:hypothetical protein